MWAALRNLIRRLSLFAAVAVILLALAIGVLRIALTQLPSYRVEIQAWILDRYDVVFDFDQLDTRLGLLGPELTFHNLEVGVAGGTENLFQSQSADVVFDAWSLLLRREIRLRRFTVDGTRIGLRRGEDGAFSMPLLERGGDSDLDVLALLPERLEVIVRNSTLDIDDAVAAERWSFTDWEVALSRDANSLTVESRAGLPEALGEEIEFSVDAEISGDRLYPEIRRLSGTIGSAELAGLSELLPINPRVSIQGNGDVSVSIDRMSDAANQGAVQMDLVNVDFSAFSDSETAHYERLAMTVEWTQSLTDGWHIAFSGVDISRNGRSWINDGTSTFEFNKVDGEPQSVLLRSNFVRLEDLRPILLSMPDTALTERWIAMHPSGEFRSAELLAERDADGWAFSVSGEFDGFGLRAVSPLPGFQGLSGLVRTDARTGRVRLQSNDASFDWPDLFAERLALERIDGTVIWRQGRDAIRVVSDNFQIGAQGGVFNSHLELSLPLDGGSPYLDLETQMPRMDMVAAKAFFPVNILKPRVVDWLTGAIQGGEISNVTLDFYGELAAFPFDDGDGLFRVTADFSNARLDFVRGWPGAEDLRGSLDFTNASFLAHGSGRVLGNVAENVDVGIEDLRNAVLTLDVATAGPVEDLLEFLNTSPQISEHMGTGFRRLHAPAGTAQLDLDLALPLRDLDAYRLDGRLQISDAELVVDGLQAPATEVTGSLTVSNSTVSGDDIEAVFMGGSVGVRVSPAELDGYRTQIDVEGETTADAVLTAFSFPYPERMAGQARWRGSLQIPQLGEETPLPTRLLVESNLTGVALRFPRPFSKPPAEPLNFQLEMLFPNEDELIVNGNLGATRRFVFNVDSTEDGYRLSRGAVSFGGDPPVLPDRRGITLDGSLPVFYLTQWLDLAGESEGQTVSALLLGGELSVAEFFVYGQQLGSTSMVFEQGEQSWRVNVDSEAVAGTLSIPKLPARRPQIIANMQRLYLSRNSATGVTDVDPRRMPGVTLKADELALGTFHLGEVTAEAVPESLGLRLLSFSSESDRMQVQGSGSWFKDSDDVTTRLQMQMSSNDIAGAMNQLGFDAVIQAEMGDIDADLQWPGPPSADWLQHVNGDVGVRFETGSVLNLEPGGAGRVLGLMSIVTVPRRLALDFRDVFNKGLAFDELTGDFSLIDGNAYTNNLILVGPTAEIGVVGRTGLRDRDYEQQAIVTAEPSNVLPTVGALVGGAGVGAALLIFTRIFKKSLRGIGQAAYCITGSWDEPTVERITQDQLEIENLCAALPPGQALD